MNSQQFVEKKFSEFYEKNLIEGPSSIHKREFGFGIWGKKIISRNLAFRDKKEFNYFLRAKNPLYVSFSAACYDFPSARPTSAKNITGSYLVYEFDADDLKTECSLKHTIWVCPSCKSTGLGAVSNCTQCGSLTEVQEWVCPECLDETKKHTLRLMDFLKEDFGFSSGLSVNFSGHKGFHLHIESEQVFLLPQHARLELLDYLTAQGLRLESQGFFLQQKRFFCPVPKNARGWSKKILLGLADLLENADAEKIAALGSVSVKDAKTISENKEAVLKAIESGYLYSLPGKKTDVFWNSIISYIVQKKALPLDRQTSTDLAKIVRVPETLHGGTGLLAKNVSLSELKKFNPLDQAIAFSNNPIRVFVKKTPKFYFDRQWLGPFESEFVELPEAAAVYLLCKQSAVLEQEEKKESV